MSTAVEEGSFETMKLLLTNGADIQRGQLLHHAIARNLPDQLQILDWLITLGVPINRLRGDGDPTSWAMWQFYQRAETSLHQAAREGKAHVVAFLLARGADVRVRNTLGETVLEVAELMDNDDVATLLRAAA